MVLRHPGQPGHQTRSHAPLGVPAFYATMLNDIDMHSAKSTVTAAGLTLDLASHLGCQGVHRQLHGTGQGTAERPLNCPPVAVIVIAVARAASTNPVTMPTGGGAPVEVYLSWCTWATRRSLSQGPTRPRLSGGWSIRRVSCTILLASNAEPKSACGSVLSGVSEC